MCSGRVSRLRMSYARKIANENHPELFLNQLIAQPLGPGRPVLGIACTARQRQAVIILNRNHIVSCTLVPFLLHIFLTKTVHFLPHSTMSARLRFALAALLSSAQISLGAYNLVKDYSGQTFFDSWSYYGTYDNLTNGMSADSFFLAHVSLITGDVIWVNQTVADGTPKLTYINGAGNAIIKVRGCIICRLNNVNNTVPPG